MEIYIDSDHIDCDIEYESRMIKSGSQLPKPLEQTGKIAIAS